MGAESKLVFTPVAEKVNQGKNLSVKGLCGSAWSFLYAQCAQAFEKNIVIICNNNEDALYVLNDLQALQEKKPLYLPYSYINAYDFEKTQTASQQQRIETLEKITSSDRKNIIVTYTEALFEKIPNKNSLSENTFKIAVKEKLSIDLQLNAGLGIIVARVYTRLIESFWKSFCFRITSTVLILLHSPASLPYAAVLLMCFLFRLTRLTA